MTYKTKNKKTYNYEYLTCIIHNYIYFIYVLEGSMNYQQVQLKYVSTQSVFNVNMNIMYLFIICSLWFLYKSLLYRILIKIYLNNKNVWIAYIIQLMKNIDKTKQKGNMIRKSKMLKNTIFYKLNDFLHDYCNFVFTSICTIVYHVYLPPRNKDFWAMFNGIND